MAWLNFSVMTIWSAMTPAGGMLPTWRRDDDKFVRYGDSGNRPPEQFSGARPN